MPSIFYAIVFCGIVSSFELSRVIYLMNMFYQRTLFFSAPAFMVAPTALPPAAFPVHIPSSDGNGKKSSNLVLFVGISVGSLIVLIIIVFFVVLCALSKGKRKTAVQETGA